ncbi:hypothetical protein N8904_01340 [Flavobacteriales bacterium]|nr:hypothetical protein [Flavobacteriales bacterium]
MKKLINLLLGLVLSFSAYTQSISLSSFEDEVFSESFNAESDAFLSIVDKENYIVIDEGDLYLNRNNQNTDFITLSKNIDLPKAYRIKTAIKMGPSLKRDSYSGIIINMSDDNSECLGIEINGKKEYRVRKIMSQTSKFLSGSEEDMGWVKNKIVNDNSVYNFIDVVYTNSSYSIFINNNLAATYEVPELKVGKFGFLVGPNAQSRIDFVTILKKSTDKSSDKFKVLESKIDKLNSNSKKLSRLEKEYKLEVENNSSVIAKKTKQISELEQEKVELIKNRDRVINDQSKKIYSLETENKLLKENQTKSIAEKTKTITELEKKNSLLTQENLKIKELEIQNKSLAEKTKIITELEKKNSLLTQENLKIKELETQNSTLRNKLDNYSDLQKENTAINQKLLQYKNVSEQNNTLKSDLQKKTQASLTAKSEINSLTKSLNETKSELAAKTASNTELSKSKSTIQSELNKLKSQNTSLNQKVKQLDTANKNSDELSKKVTQLSAALTSTKNELEEQKKNSLRLQNENGKLSKSLAITNSKLSESSQLKNDLNDFKNGFIEMESANSVLNNKIATLNSKVTTLNSELSKYKNIEKEFEQNQLLLDKTNASLAKKTKQLNDLEKQVVSIQELNGQIATLSNKVQQQNTKIKTNEDEIASLTQKLKSAEEERGKALLENKTVKVQIERQKLIASQFAESYQLEKEKNKQYQNEILNFNLGEISSKSNDSIIYRVQLGIFDDLIDIEGLEDVSTIYTKNQQIIYISGKFNNFSSARTYLVKMREKGFEDSFIVKF